ncbi:hypothetical protein GR200_30840 [Rhizobium leguminosarum]|uniref:hypothetical protein n=1 Tax=Rhizobium leguminosarum TaxID=384 RepID=UPI0013B69EF4|nr:hypothetical protein [Rhizobium leguminosarum]NEI59429.1 hypothetical protein [Rhizobium leguminosarum]NEI88269.1 hypothetical protein [Rhizobium leguminosarum]
MSEAFNGRWTYRSFRSNPDIEAPFDQLEFGRANLVISESADGEVGGTIGSTGWSLNVTGTVTSGDPSSIRFTGSGQIGGENWVYDYLGFLVPPWPNGIDQRPAIVGTIVRTVPHSNGDAAAGVVAQWIAEKQNN